MREFDREMMVGSYWNQRRRGRSDAVRSGGRGFKLGVGHGEYVKEGRVRSRC